MANRTSSHAGLWAQLITRLDVNKLRTWEVKFRTKQEAAGMRADFYRWRMSMQPEAVERQGHTGEIKDSIMQMRVKAERWKLTLDDCTLRFEMYEQVNKQLYEAINKLPLVPLVVDEPPVAAPKHNPFQPQEDMEDVLNDFLK